MSKKKTAPRKRAQSTPLPPIAVALARMIEPNMQCVNDDFVRAWESMPSFLTAYAAGKSDSIDVVSASSFIDRLVEDAIAKSRKSTEPFGDELAQAKDAIDAANPDHWIHLYTAIEDPAFTVGVALGAYVALNGTGGAR